MVIAASEIILLWKEVFVLAYRPQILVCDMLQGDPILAFNRCIVVFCSGDFIPTLGVIF